MPQTGDLVATSTTEVLNTVIKRDESPPVIWVSLTFLGKFFILSGKLNRCLNFEGLDGCTRIVVHFTLNQIPSGIRPRIFQPLSFVGSREGLTWTFSCCKLAHVFGILLQ